MTVAAVPHAARGLPDALIPVLERQRWLVTTAQLTQAGVGREQIRWGLARRWSSPLPRVIRIGDGSLPDSDRPMAAHLHAGPRSALAGATAAVEYGVEAARTRDGVVHLIVPGRCADRRERWVHVHRTTVEDAGVRIRHGVPMCSPGRAVVDAARWSATDDTATAVMIEACQRELATPQHLRDQLEMFGRAPGTARARRALDAAESGAWSIPERDLALLVERSRRLPTPWLNPLVSSVDGRRLVSPDLWFDDVALAVMVHSKAHHRIGDDWSRTVEADAELTAAGVHVVGITPTTIRTDPRAALDLVERAYLSATEANRTRRVIARPRR